MPEFKPDEIVVAITAFAIDEPKPMVIALGQRLRGDHPAVLANPQFFKRDGE